MNNKEARAFALEIFDKLEDVLKKDFLLVHSEKVGLMADFIASHLNINNDIFIIAGWLHDIGSAIEDDNHAEHSISILEKRNIFIDPTLKDCILNHGNEGVPKTIEGKIFQLADKLSIFDLETIKVFINQGGIPMKNDYIEFLKTLSDKALFLLNRDLK